MRSVNRFHMLQLRYHRYDDIRVIKFTFKEPKRRQTVFNAATLICDTMLSQAID